MFTATVRLERGTTYEPSLFDEDGALLLAGGRLAVSHPSHPSPGKKRVRRNYSFSSSSEQERFLEYDNEPSLSSEPPEVNSVADSKLASLLQGNRSGGKLILQNHQFEGSFAETSRSAVVYKTAFRRGTTGGRCARARPARAHSGTAGDSEGRGWEQRWR